MSSTSTSESAAEVQAEMQLSTPLEEFYSFTKLPLEIRLAIWGHAAPEPALVIQQHSKKKNRKFCYLRRAPAALHVCSESRNEYLEIEGPDISLGRRRRNHPVYKLCFGGSLRSRCGVFISFDVDSFLPYCESLMSDMTKCLEGLPAIKSLAFRIDRGISRSWEDIRVLVGKQAYLTYITILLPPMKMFDNKAATKALFLQRCNQGYQEILLKGGEGPSPGRKVPGGHFEWLEEFMHAHGKPTQDDGRHEEAH